MLILLVGADTGAIVSDVWTWGSPTTEVSLENFQSQDMMGENSIGMNGGQFETSVPGNNVDVGFYGYWGTP